MALSSYIDYRKKGASYSSSSPSAISLDKSNGKTILRPDYVKRGQCIVAVSLYGASINSNIER